jgi:hypothetical protein
MADPLEAQYEDYLHSAGDSSGLRDEIAQREKSGWSLWSTEPIGDKCVVIQFKRPSEWATESPDH